MGSKRSSKNPSKVLSSPPPAHSPADGNQENPNNPSLASPSKTRKKAKLSNAVATDSGFLSSTPTAAGESHTQDSNRKGKVPEVSIDISTSDGPASRSNLFRWDEADTLKLLKAVIIFREKNGSLPTRSNMNDFLTAIMGWVPSQLSEKNLDSKLRHLRFKFQNIDQPGPDSSEYDRSFYELASKAWKPENMKPKGSAADSVKEVSKDEKKDNKKGKKGQASKKPNVEKKKMVPKTEDMDGVEEEERDSDNDEGTEEKAGKFTLFVNGDDHNKDELPVDKGNDLLDANGAQHSYKYLRIALEEYWTESKMNLDTLYTALPKLDPVQAKRLNEQFQEVYVGILKLKMEKNKLSNEIIRVSLGC